MIADNKSNLQVHRLQLAYMWLKKTWKIKS